MLESGYIRLYRSFLTWEWYSDSATKDVFLHLILTANWEPKKWKGITVERGQRVYSSQKLAEELHMSRQATRTAINHLIETGEVTNRSTPQYSIVTIKNYDLYQQPTNELTNDQPTDSVNKLLTRQNGVKNQPSIQPSINQPESVDMPFVGEFECSRLTNESTSDQPTANQPLTNDQPQLKKDKESKKAIKSTYRAFAPPTLDDVIAYCRERSSSVDPQKFFDYFDAGGWVDSRGNHVKNWKQKIITWEGREKRGGNEQTSGSSEKAPSKWHIRSELDGL